MAAAKQRRIRAAELELGLVRRQAGGLRRGRPPASSTLEAAVAAGHELDPFDDSDAALDMGGEFSDCPRGACPEGDCEGLSDVEMEAYDVLSYPACDDGAGGSACLSLDGVSDSPGAWPDTRRSTVSPSGTSASSWRHGGGYVPGYRERFFIEDSSECWRGNGESPADALDGVPPGTIVAVIVIDGDGLTRGLRGVRSAAAKRDARGCLAAALDGAAADAAASAERCLGQHAIVGARCCSYRKTFMRCVSSVSKLRKLHALWTTAMHVEALIPAPCGAQAPAVPRGTAWTAARAGAPTAAASAAGSASVGPPRQPRGRASASGVTSGCWAPPRRRWHFWRPRPGMPGGQPCWSSCTSTPSTGPSRSWHRR